MENTPKNSGSSRLLRIAEKDAGARLDSWIGRELQLSRMAVRRLLEQGCVQLNHRIENVKSKGIILAVGDAIQITQFVAPQDLAATPQADGKLTLLAQGPGWIAVDKPAGMPVHPLEAGETGTVLNQLIYQFPQLQGIGEGGLRSGVVHRLDVTTSGVLLFATEQAVWERLRNAFVQHRTHKLYHALVQGNLTGGDREEIWLYVAQHKPAKVKVAPQAQARELGARRCDLQWKSLENMPQSSLLEIKLGTGFLHQIRVTLAHREHAVIGDELYGTGGSAPLRVGRPMLHAVEFTLGEIHAQSPYPGDFARTLEALRKS